MKLRSAKPISTTLRSERRHLGETPLGETPLGETPLGETLISDIQTQSCTTIFVSCPPGNHTIDQHLGELQPNVTIADLVAVLTPAARRA